MFRSSLSQRLLGVSTCVVLAAVAGGQSASTKTAPNTTANAQKGSGPVATAEEFNYLVEWHMITAGTVHIETTPQGQGWQTAVEVASAGTLSRLYRVEDNYRVQMDSRVCPSSANLDAQEGRKHNLTKLSFDGAKNRVSYVGQDLVKNVTLRDDLSVVPCTREILTALTAVRSLALEPGKAISLAITDGRKFTHARVEAQAKENLLVEGKQISATRYEAFVFDNALYKRKGRLFIWVSDDGEQLPVQLRFQMSFPIGNVLVALQSHRRL